MAVDSPNALVPMLQRGDADPRRSSGTTRPEVHLRHHVLPANRPTPHLIIDPH